MYIHYIYIYTHPIYTYIREIHLCFKTKASPECYMPVPVSNMLQANFQPYAIGTL